MLVLVSSVLGFLLQSFDTTQIFILLLAIHPLRHCMDILHDTLVLLVVTHVQWKVWMNVSIVIE
jgi:hypothetical protein